MDRGHIELHMAHISCRCLFYAFIALCGFAVWLVALSLALVLAAFLTCFVLYALWPCSVASSRAPSLKNAVPLLPAHPGPPLQPRVLDIIGCHVVLALPFPTPPCWLSPSWSRSNSTPNAVAFCQAPGQERHSGHHTLYPCPSARHSLPSCVCSFSDLQQWARRLGFYDPAIITAWPTQQRVR